jgi:hypothetical protein
MFFSLDVRRARKGDCLLMHFGSRTEPGLVMIDGGPKSVYLPFLKPRLLEIRKARGLDSQTPLAVDRLMVSHVDDDHIQGILDLTRELRAAAGTPPLLRIAGFWHNSFDDIIGKDPKELTAAVGSQFGTASLNGNLPPDATIDLGARASSEEKEVARSSLQVLASIPQGRQLRGDAEALGIPLNPDFDGRLILAAKKEVTLAPGFSFVVAGPMVPELKALQKLHDAWLKTQKKLSGPAALAAYVDQSVPNLSSIVVLAKAGGKTVLLTGDARGDKILKGLEAAGVMSKGGKMKVDVLKVPHHGSSNNLDDDFFERITADHYVFSGDGEHGNPERESMEMLFKARGKQPFRLHLTYPVKEIDAGRKADWDMEQTKEKKTKTDTGKGTVRENWSPAKHGLAAFFEKVKLAAGQKIDVVDAKKPHVIDLLDPLGF